MLNDVSDDVRVKGGVHHPTRICESVLKASANNRNNRLSPGNKTQESRTDAQGQASGLSRVAPDDLLIDINPRSSEVELAIYKLKKILPLLTGEEIQLMTLVADGMPYAKILKHRMFKDKNYTVDILTKMVHNIRQKAGEMKNQSDKEYNNDK